MPYVFDVQEKPGYLLFTLSGVAETVDEMRRFSEVMVTRAQASNCKRVLLDERATIKTLDFHDCMVHAERWVSEKPRIGLRIAAVYSPVHARDFHWVETIFQNRSIVYKIFDAMEEAEQWLMS